MVEEQVAMIGTEQDEAPNAGEGTMITALCWVSRGYAKPMLQEADPEADEANIMEHARMQKKLAG